MAISSLTLPEHLYPVFAPLPVAFANHLVLLEHRLSGRKAVSRRLSSERLWKIVEERVCLARNLVYDYMSPFVLVEQHRIEQGLPRQFPEEAWLLNALATYSPDGIRYSAATIELWQRKRLLRREKPRGMFALDSVAALLITRIVEGEHQRNWLPSEIPAGEPIWWCYEQSGVEVARQPVAFPLPATHLEPMLLSTPWCGARWLSQRWHVFDKVAVCWSERITSLQQLEQWDAELAGEIAAWHSHPLLGSQATQTVLLQEASSLILERVARTYQ